MSDYTFESEYWGDCCNTFDEDQKHYVYGRFMGLDRVGYSFDVYGRSIIDIGGGPTSMLLKTKNLGRGLVVDPLLYPDWTYDRYAAKKIECLVFRGEDVVEEGFDEAWIYNCLQHVESVERIINNAKRAAPVLRLFEWINIPPHDGHPFMLTKDMLDGLIALPGSGTVTLRESGCYGKAYYGVFKQ